MRILLFILVFFIIGCRDKKTPSLFGELTELTDVKIHLVDYGLENIPAEIGDLKNAKRICISKDSTTGWTLYPPLGRMYEERSKPPYKQLPDQITTLTGLKSLTLVGLDLNTLPDSFGRLKELDTLILYMNKLTIANELDKLKGLKKLKYLGLMGNIVTANDLEELERSIPGIVTNPGLR
ncbi:MAG: hypothetical protein WDN26_19680 [Chitinophagaceae bacterium]